MTKLHVLDSNCQDRPDPDFREICRKIDRRPKRDSNDDGDLFLGALVALGAELIAAGIIALGWAVTHGWRLFR